jgi:3-methyladenine DNA glycosylase AlkD
MAPSRSDRPRASTDEVLRELRAVADPERLPGMARVGIRTDRALGVSIPHCRRIAKRHGPDHELALGLWASEIHEARIVAGLVDDVDALTKGQMDAWVVGFDSWDVCDQVCNALFAPSPLAEAASRRWVRRRGEFVKRAGFVLVAARAARVTDPDDEPWLAWLPSIAGGALDERNYVKKAVSWALREIGKRDRALNAAAIEVARELRASETPSARWVGGDAERELTSAAVQARLEEGRMAFGRRIAR